MHKLDNLGHLCFRKSCGVVFDLYAAVSYDLLEAFAVNDGWARLIILCLEIHICWKVDREARIEPPIHTEYLLSGGATTLTFIVEGARL